MELLNENKEKDTLGCQSIHYHTFKSKFQQRMQAFTFIQTSSSHRKTCGELLLGGKQLRLQVGQDWRTHPRILWHTWANQRQRKLCKIVHRAKVQIQTLNRRHPLSYVIIYIALIYKKFICRFQTLTIFKDTRAYTTSRDVSKYRKKNKIQSRSKKELSDNVKTSWIWILSRTSLKITRTRNYTKW